MARSSGIGYARSPREARPISHASSIASAASSSSRTKASPMYMSRRQQQIERQERRAVQDRREDEAGKLLNRIPNLTSLSLSIHEGRSDASAGENHYIRRVVIESAPALFEIRCSNPQCDDGGFDITREVLAALASGKSTFEGQQACQGRGRTMDCTRVLRFVGTATYKEPLSS